MSCLAALGLLNGVGCVNPDDEVAFVETATAAVVGNNFSGTNLGGMNLGGMNLGGMNLGGMNLGGPNLGGMNLGGMNLGGMNLGGMNLGGANFGGNNLGGMNLAATNLGGMNLGGMNLGGMNLAGMNIAGSNLNGSNVAGTNLGGMNLGGMNLGGMNLAGPSTGSNLHNLSGPIDGMLYSGEDLWLPKTGQCIVLGIGSTAFPKLLAQQSPNAKISVALGKLPWGFPAVQGGPIALQAWEAIVWGNQSYCTFLLVTPPASHFAGVAGFIKAIFRWNAPPTQTMEISGIEASAPHDGTLSTQVASYTGMMNAAAKFNAGIVSATDFVAGELAFVTATTNNEVVWVDFASWVRDVSGMGKVLGNVEKVKLPQYAEGVYHVFSNADGTVGVSVADVGVDPGYISAHSDLATSYTAYQRGEGPKPVPSRCSGSLYLNVTYNEPIPAGKCDSGLTWTTTLQGYPPALDKWSSVPGTTFPMNEYMFLSKSLQNPLLRSPGRPILSETYVHLWEPNHVLPAAAIGGAAGSDRTGLGVGVSNALNCSDSNGPSVAFNNLDGGSWCGKGKPTSSSPLSIMYAWGAAIPITSYRITSSADYSVRDPKNWTFQGCTGTCTVGADTGWVTLDTRSNQAFTARLQSKSYTFSNGIAYSRYRLRISAISGNTDMVQLREIQMFDSGGSVVALPGVDKTDNGVVSWTGKPCSSGELPTRAFDNLMTSAAATRWCVSGIPSVARPVSIAYGWGPNSQTVASYRITSASDFPDRDPRSWTFQGCNGACRVGADDGWVTLDTRSSQTFASRHLTKTYTLSAPAAYTAYRLRVTANNGDSTLQLGELQLY